jgi:hypothetical protein
VFARPCCEQRSLLQQSCNEDETTMKDFWQVSGNIAVNQLILTPSLTISVHFVISTTKRRKKNGEMNIFLLGSINAI